MKNKEHYNNKNNNDNSYLPPGERPRPSTSPEISSSPVRVSTHCTLSNRNPFGSNYCAGDVIK